MSRDNFEPKTLNIDILTLEAFINLWLCKTRMEIELLCKGDDTLKEDMLKSQLSSPLEAWHNIQEKLKIKVVDIEDCTVLGYSWAKLKQVVDFAKSKNFEPHSERTWSKLNGYDNDGNPIQYGIHKGW